MSERLRSDLLERVFHERKSRASYFTFTGVDWQDRPLTVTTVIDQDVQFNIALLSTVALAANLGNSRALAGFPQAWTGENGNILKLRTPEEALDLVTAAAEARSSVYAAAFQHTQAIMTADFEQLTRYNTEQGWPQ